MKRFLSRMNFPRWVILVMAVASIGLGIWLYFEQKRLKQVQADLSKVKDEIVKIQTLGMELDDLQSIAEKEGLKEQDNPESYIREIAQQARVDIGQVDTSARVSNPDRGVIDNHTSIRPQDAKRRFNRTNLANFLYRLEEGSQRVKITDFKLTPVGQLKPGQLGDDAWTFSAEITSRSLENAAQGGE